MNSQVILNIFFSYSHKDESLCTELLKHLTPLKDADLINNWYDRQITPGEDWDKQIKLKLNESDIILFLISPDFLASKYIYEHEIKTAIERHKNGEAIVVPIMLRKCDIEYTLFKDIQGLPTDFEPILSKKWYSVDDACFDVVVGLKKIIHQVRKKKELLQTAHFINNDIPKRNLKKKGYLTQFRNFINLFGEAKDLRFKNIVLNSQLQFIESERQEIGQEIHDNIGQLLTLAKFILATKFSNDDSKEIKNLKELISGSLNSLRQLSHRLKLGSFEIDFNLKEALLRLESHFLSVSSLRFQFIFKNIDALDNPRLEVNVFRIIQELLNNVVKHANATYCDLSVSYDEKKISIKIQDNGAGFDVKEVRKGIGLDGIESRVVYYNGTIAIKSNKNSGTNLEISIPVK